MLPLREATYYRETLCTVFITSCKSIHTLKEKNFRSIHCNRPFFGGRGQEEAHLVNHSSFLRSLDFLLEKNGINIAPLHTDNGVLNQGAFILPSLMHLYCPSSMTPARKFLSEPRSRDMIQAGLIRLSRAFHLGQWCNKGKTVRGYSFLSAHKALVALVFQWLLPCDLLSIFSVYSLLLELADMVNKEL